MDTSPHGHRYRQHTGLLSPLVDGMRVRRAVRLIRPDSRVLDVGCGSARLLPALPAGCWYLGLDRDEAVLAASRARHPSARFARVDVASDRFPVEDAAIDAVILAAVLEHLDRTDHLLSEVRRVMRPDGCAVITTPTRAGGAVHRVLAFLRLLSRDAAEEHHGYWNRARLRDAAAQAGLGLETHRHFQLGLNQVAVLRRLSPGATGPSGDR